MYPKICPKVDLSKDLTRLKYSNLASPPGCAAVRYDTLVPGIQLMSVANTTPYLQAQNTWHA
jgi:hypothetical protein